MASNAPHDAQSQAGALQQGPPYRPQFQSLGEIPSIFPDVPVNAVFLVLFIAACTSHVLVFRQNIANGKKFIISAMVFGFCITRIIATSLRIAWASSPTNIHVGITAMIFVYAGIVLLFLANLFFAQRIVRAQHPRFGWSKPVSFLFPPLIIITIGTILCLIAAIIVKFYTLSPYSQNAASSIQKYGATWLAVVSFLPIPLVGISSVVRRHPKIRMTKTTDKFGEGSMRAKVAIVLISAVLLCLGASFRAGTTLMPPVPILNQTNPPRPAPEPWYLSKACFYIFNFTMEICVCFFWLAVRIDKRFFIPDGANGPFSYAGGFIFAGEVGNEKRRISHIVGGSQQELTGASPYQSRPTTGRRLSRNSVASLNKLEDRISWGGISHEGIEPAVAEDGVSVLPYTTETEGGTSADVGVDGVIKEMGWDPKSGKWALRPVSGVRNAGSRPGSMISNFQ